MKKTIMLTVAILVFVPACVPAPSQSQKPTPIAITAVVSTVVAESTETGPAASATLGFPTSIPTLPSGSLTPSELKYRILDQFPGFFFCDPDYYPVAREDELNLAQQRFDELRANEEEFQAILDRTGLSGQTAFSDPQKLQIYREHKRLSALLLDASGEVYQFSIQTGMEGQQGSRITGTIDGAGSIQILTEDVSMPMCPICLAAGTLIDTPDGPVAVENLRQGMPVWTTNAAGGRVAGTVLWIGYAIVPNTHRIVHLTLNDGRELRASPGHPTADGRFVGSLRVGDTLDGARVIETELLEYEEYATYDLLPSAGSGLYWADGVLLRSSLANP